MAIECEHGHLARKCETCSANAEITRLAADVASVTMERDYAVSTIRCYGEILVNAGYSSGDRVTIRENLKRMVSDIAKLREALGPFAKDAEEWSMSNYPDECAVVSDCYDKPVGVATIGDLRRAAQAMDETK